MVVNVNGWHTAQSTLWVQGVLVCPLTSEDAKDKDD